MCFTTSYLTNRIAPPDKKMNKCEANYPSIYVSISNNLADNLVFKKWYVKKLICVFLNDINPIFAKSALCASYTHVWDHRQTETDTHR